MFQAIDVTNRLAQAISMIALDLLAVKIELILNVGLYKIIDIDVPLGSHVY